jgi:hypothetical protein
MHKHLSHLIVGKNACVNGCMQHVQMQCMLRAGDYIRAHAVVDAAFPAAAFVDTLQLLLLLAVRPVFIHCCQCFVLLDHHGEQ